MTSSDETVRNKSEFEAWHERMHARRRAIDAMPVGRKKLAALQEVQAEYKRMDDLLTHVLDRHEVPRRLTRR